MFEESPAQFLRNMRSLGLDLQQWIDAGLLRIWAARPSAVGLETHLAILAELIEDETPSVAVLDGIANIGSGILATEEASLVARKIDLLKSREITTLVTALGPGDETSKETLSSLVDTWLLAAQRRGQR